MKKLLVTLMLVAICSNAMAKWVEVISIPEEGITLYADPATISMSGKIAKMQELLDFKSGENIPDNKLIYSLVSRMEYDCENEQVRALNYVGFTENMGRGTRVEDDSAPGAEWKSIEIDGISMKKMWEFACGK